jgi:hypothetical protein
MIAKMYAVFYKSALVPGIFTKPPVNGEFRSWEWELKLKEDFKGRPDVIRKYIEYKYKFLILNNTI